MNKYSIKLELQSYTPLLYGSQTADTALNTKYSFIRFAIFLGQDFRFSS